MGLYNWERIRAQCRKVAVMRGWGRERHAEMEEERNRVVVTGLDLGQGNHYIQSEFKLRAH